MGKVKEETREKQRSRVRRKTVFREINLPSDPAAGGEREDNSSRVIASEGRRSVSHAGIYP